MQKCYGWVQTPMEAGQSMSLSSSGHSCGAANDYKRAGSTALLFF